jgi:hypothetical protein
VNAQPDRTAGKALLSPPLTFVPPLRSAALALGPRHGPEAALKKQKQNFFPPGRSGKPHMKPPAPN